MPLPGNHRLSEAPGNVCSPPILKARSAQSNKMQSITQTRSPTEANNLSLNKQTIAAAGETTSIAGLTNGQVQSSSNPDWVIFFPKNDAKIFKVGRLYVGHLDEVPVPSDIRKKWETHVVTKLEEHLLLTTQKLGNSIPSKDTMVEAQLCMAGKYNKFLLKRNSSNCKTDVALRPTVWISCGSSKCKKKVQEEIDRLLYLTHFLETYHMDPPHISRGGPWPCTGEEPQQNLFLGIPTEHISFAVRQPLPGSTKFPSICGTVAMFTIRTAQQDTKRYSTVGGLICVEDEIYGLTTGHAVITECLNGNASDQSNSTNDSSSSSDSGSESSLIAGRELKNSSGLKDYVSPSERWITLEFPKVLAYLRCGTKVGDWKFTESAPVTSDFALFDPRQIVFDGVTNSYRWNGSSQTIISDHLPAHELCAGEVLIIVSCGGVPLRGQLLDGNSALIIQGTMIRTKKVRIGRPADQGMSGSWIVREDKLCGIVYAAYDRSPYLHMIPAETIFNDIKEMLRVSEARVATAHDISVLTKTNHISSPNVSKTVQDRPNQPSDSLTEEYGSTQFSGKQRADEHGDASHKTSNLHSPSIPRIYSPSPIYNPPFIMATGGHLDGDQPFLSPNAQPQANFTGASMTATSLRSWIWSQQHRDYYYVTFDSYGRPIYTFSQAIGVVAQPTYITPPLPNYPQLELPTEPVPSNVRINRSNFISGDPGGGYKESLDPTYTIRTGIETQRFFQVGRVFATLYSETDGGHSVFDEEDDAYSVVRYGEVVYSDIRRFVVVDVRHGFVYACAISTYKNQGTLKKGCIPSEHAVVYFTNTDPQTCYFDGERDKGMTKDPIKVIPADCQPPLRMKAGSRIRFSKQFAIEMNVKVKDIGQVHPEHKSKFLNYYREYCP